MAYEYKTVAGPDKGKRKARGRKVGERVAEAMEDIIREETAAGWDYLRTDVVPVEERASFFSRRRTIHCPVLVFRRQLGARAEPRPELAQRAARIFASARAEMREAVEPQISVPRPPERLAPQVAAPPPPPPPQPMTQHREGPLTLTPETRIDRPPSAQEEYSQTFPVRRGAAQGREEE